MTDVRARMSQSARNGLRYVLCGLGLLLALLTASCGNGIFVPGTPIFTITDRSGEFTSFIVTLYQIQLTRNDNTVVTLPMINQRVDLVELSNLAEIMGAPAVEEGTYVSMTLTLIYTGAQITVDVNGQSVPTTILDPTTSPANQAAGTQTFTVQFDPNNPLVITNQKSNLVNIDIDLAASTTIDFSNPANPTVYIKSFATGNAIPVYTKPIRARGLFVIADTANNNFIMNVRPFHDISNSPFGAMTVQPTAQTYYNINGTSYTGAAGLAALASIQNVYADFQVQVYGTGPGAGSPFSSLSTITPSFVPTAVYAGTSVESTIQDHIVGVVQGISGNTLTVLGGEFIWRYGGNSVYGGGISLVNTVPITVSSATAVTQDGVIPATPLSISSVSVGQLIDVSGQATLDANGNPLSLDATAGPTQPNGGQIRLQSTAAWGTVVSLAPTATCTGMTLDLGLLGNYIPDPFSFVGTQSGGGTGNPDAYCVNTGSLDLSAITAASANSAQPLVRVDGLVAPFGAGPPDFNATAATLGSATTDQQLILEWTGGGTGSPFTTTQANSLVPNMTLSNFNGIHEIRTGPNNLDVTTLPAGFSITPVAVGSNALLLSVGNTTNAIQTFNSAGPWVTAITTALGKSILISKLVASGYYDPTANTFNAYNISINE